jgi:hypothetical protein
MNQLLATSCLLLAFSMMACAQSLDDVHIAPRGSIKSMAADPKQSEPLSFRGVAPGITSEQFKDVIDGWIGKEMAKLNITYRSVYGTVECSQDGRTADCLDIKDGISAHFLDGKLCYASWLLEHADWRLFSDALKQKYGDPEHTRITEVQNRMGAKFSGVGEIWTRGDTTMLLDEYATHLDNSWLSIQNRRERTYEALTKHLPDI